jgi:hypothetical protein
MCREFGCSDFGGSISWCAAIDDGRLTLTTKGILALFRNSEAELVVGERMLQEPQRTPLRRLHEFRCNTWHSIWSDRDVGLDNALQHGATERSKNTLLIISVKQYMLVLSICE